MDLVLNTFGVSLSRDNEGFVVLSKEGKQRIPVGGITSIQISKGTQITSDAVLLAIEKEIEVLFMDRSGYPLGRVWSSKYGSISTIRKCQLNFAFSKDAVVWIKDVLSRKMENQQALLLMMCADLPNLECRVKNAIGRIENFREKVADIKGEVVSDIAPFLRGWEGMSSKIYFDTLNLFFPEEYHFNGRYYFIWHICMFLI